jgi:hypothetical protein
MFLKHHIFSQLYYFTILIDKRLQYFIEILINNNKNMLFFTFEIFITGFKYLNIKK